jgi:hypothetical protein
MTQLPNLHEALCGMRRGTASEEIMRFSGALLLEVAKSGAFPAPTLAQMLSAIRESLVPAHEDGWRLVDLLDEHWGTMSHGQQHATVGTLASAFWISSQDMFQFRIAEMFGEHLPVDWILEWIGSRMATSTRHARVCMVHALADACRREKSAALPSPALLRVLRSAQLDDSNEVREEAARALSELGERQ